MNENDFGQEFAALTAVLVETAVDAKEVGSPAIRLTAIEQLRKFIANFNIALIEDMTYDPMNP